MNIPMQGTAVATMRIAVQQRTQALAANPGDTRAQRALAIAHDSLGRALRAAGDTPGAIAEFRAAISVFERRAAHDPAGARDLAVAQHGLARTLVMQGDGAGAIPLFRSELTIALRLAAAAPDDPNLQSMVAGAQSGLGRAMLSTGDAAGAVPLMRAGLTISQRLAALGRNHADLDRDVAASQYGLGCALEAVGDAAGALSGFKAALAGYEGLAAREPDNGEWQRSAATVRGSVDRLQAAGLSLPAAPQPPPAKLARPWSRWFGGGAAASSARVKSNRSETELPLPPPALPFHAGCHKGLPNWGSDRSCCEQALASCREMPFQASFVSVARGCGASSFGRSGAPPVGVAGKQLGEQVGKILDALGARRAMLGVAALPEDARRIQAALAHVPETRVGSVPSPMSAVIVRSHSARRLETIRQARIMSGSGAAERRGQARRAGRARPPPLLPASPPVRRAAPRACGTVWAEAGGH